jgi:hypothetical protein
MQECTPPEEDELKDAIMKTSIIFESISRSSLLVKLRRCYLGDGVLWGAFCHATRTLLDFTYYTSYSTMSYRVAQAIGSGAPLYEYYVHGTLKSQWQITITLHLIILLSYNRHFGETSTRLVSRCLTRF